MAAAPFDHLRKADVAGAHLAYVEEGNGDPVVFVHGGTADLRVWANQLPVIAQSYRAIAYSQRYCRPNPPIDPDAPNPFDPHVDDLAELIGEIGGGTAHVVGSSSGAFITLLAAIRTPDRFRSLVLAEPPALSLFVSTPPRPLELLKVFSTHPRTAVAILKFALGTILPTTQAFQRGNDDEALRIFLRGVLGDPWLSQLPASAMEVLRDNVDTLRGGLLHDEIGFPPLADADVRAITIPVLLVTGGRSPAIFARLADRLEALLPNVERVAIPNASHVMFQDDPTAFNEAVLAFLARQDRRSR